MLPDGAEDTWPDGAEASALGWEPVPVPPKANFSIMFTLPDWGYSNVQLDTKCVVEKSICAVENSILCSNFLRKCCIMLFWAIGELNFAKFYMQLHKFSYVFRVKRRIL